MSNRPLTLGLILLSVVVGSCTSLPEHVKESGMLNSATTASKAQTFKVVTYNVWHGLNAGSFWVTPSETPKRHQARFQLQIRQLARVNADVVFLQEVNPLPQRARDYVNELKAYGLEYSEVHQVDACGIRVSQNRALISELNNGLVILAKKELQLRPIEGLKLNGGVGSCQSTWGFQLEELRYAVVAEISMPGTKKKYLVASVHQHSGLEGGASFIQKLSKVHEQGQLDRYPQVKWEFEKPQIQRTDGLATMMRGLRKLDRRDDYAGWILGGDFNFEPEDPEYEEATGRLRLLDTSSIATRSGELFTFDPGRNPINVEEMDPNMPASLENALSKEKPENRQAILAAYQAEMIRPRRIDHIFVDSFLPDYCLEQQLFGLETGDDGRPGSDHYGLLNIYTSPHQEAGSR